MCPLLCLQEARPLAHLLLDGDVWGIPHPRPRQSVERGGLFSCTRQPHSSVTDGHNAGVDGRLGQRSRHGRPGGSRGPGRTREGRGVPGLWYPVKRNGILDYIVSDPVDAFLPAKDWSVPSEALRRWSLPARTTRLLHARQELVPRIACCWTRSLLVCGHARRLMQGFRWGVGCPHCTPYCLPLRRGGHGVRRY